jgi:hypothetical protein
VRTPIQTAREECQADLFCLTIPLFKPHLFLKLFVPLRSICTVPLLARAGGVFDEGSFRPDSLELLPGKPSHSTEAQIESGFAG